LLLGVRELSLLLDHANAQDQIIEFWKGPSGCNTPLLVGTWLLASTGVSFPLTLRHFQDSRHIRRLHSIAVLLSVSIIALQVESFFTLGLAMSLSKPPYIRSLTLHLTFAFSTASNVIFIGLEALCIGSSGVGWRITIIRFVVIAHCGFFRRPDFLVSDRHSETAFCSNHRSFYWNVGRGNES
jgi:hypothetical protein